MDDTKLVVDILSAAIPVRVTTEVPATMKGPQRLVTVDQMGGSADEFVSRPRYMLTVWGLTDMDAKALALRCVEALWEASEDHPLLSACALESMSRDEWASTGQGRYVAVVDLTINKD